MYINKKSLSGRFVNWLYVKDWIRDMPTTLFGHISTSLFFALMFAIIAIAAIFILGIIGLYILGSFSISSYSAIDGMGIGILLLAIIFILAKLIKILKSTKVNYK